MTWRQPRVGCPERRVLDASIRRDPAVIGETITVKRQVLTVIGVAPAGFFGERVGQVPDVWVPLHMQARFESASLLGDPRTGWLRVIGRLRNDVADTQATAVFESFLDRVDPGDDARRYRSVHRQASALGWQPGP